MSKENSLAGLDLSLAMLGFGLEMIDRLALISGLFLSCAFNCAAAAANDEITEMPALVCGPNCVCMLLQLRGLPYDIHALERLVPSNNSEGMSLVELKDACQEFGLESDVDFFPGLHLPRDISTPFIAFCHNAHTRSGHYVVVLDADKDRVTYLDGTTGNPVTMPADRFLQFWTGYAVIPRPVVNEGPIFYIMIILSALIAIRVFTADRGKGQRHE